MYGSRVLEATTRPFLKMECQLSMCEPLKHRERAGKVKSEVNDVLMGSKYNKPWCLLIALSFLVKYHVVLSDANRQLLKEDAFLPHIYGRLHRNSHPLNSKPYSLKCKRCFQEF